MAESENEAFRLINMSFSSYVRKLDDGERGKYCSKLTSLGFNQFSDDPFYVKESKSKDIAALWSIDFVSFPPVEYGQIYNYLIDSPGQYTRETMKAYKSLDAYNYFSSGWVGELSIRHSDTGHCIIRGTVNRSQAVPEKSHEAWVGCTADGTVSCAHGTCMAGLGLVCSHVAAVLFKIEYGNRMDLNKVVCTSQQCVWNQQSVKRVDGIPLEDISFKTKREVGPPPARVSRARLDPSLLQDLKLFAPKGSYKTTLAPKKYPPINKTLPPVLAQAFKDGNGRLEATDEERGGI